MYLECEQNLQMIIMQSDLWRRYFSNYWIDLLLFCDGQLLCGFHLFNKNLKKTLEYNGMKSQ